MAKAQAQGWALVALDCAVDTTTPAGEAMAHVLATFAQFERRLIGQRTQEALAIKRAEGVRLGRPATITPQLARRIRSLQKRVVDLAEPSAGRSRVELAAPREVTPEEERVSVPAMRARRKQVARLDNRRTHASRVNGDGQLPFDVGRIHTGSAARYARHDGRRPQVHEHMPRLAQHNGLVAPQAMGISDCDRGIDRTQVAILDRRSGPPADLRAGKEKVA